MTKYEERAAELFLSGYNCCQAVAGAFADKTDLDEETMLKLSSAFGGGFARTRNICGAVSAMGMILGLAESSGDAGDKANIYAKTRELTDKFTEENGSLICAELLEKVKGITDSPVPDQRTAEYYKKRPCVKYVMAAANILEKKLEEDRT